MIIQCKKLVGKKRSTNCDLQRRDACVERILYYASKLGINIRLHQISINLWPTDVYFFNSILLLKIFDCRPLAKPHTNGKLTKQKIDQLLENTPRNKRKKHEEERMRAKNNKKISTIWNREDLIEVFELK